MNAGNEEFTHRTHGNVDTILAALGTLLGTVDPDVLERMLRSLEAGARLSPAAAGTTPEQQQSMLEGRLEAVAFLRMKAAAVREAQDFHS